MVRDITETYAREKQLRWRSRMIDSSRGAIILMDGQRRITGWNRGATEIYGWSESEVPGRHSGSHAGSA